MGEIRCFPTDAYCKCIKIWVPFIDNIRKQIDSTPAKWVFRTVSCTNHPSPGCENLQTNQANMNIFITVAVETEEF